MLALYSHIVSNHYVANAFIRSRRNYWTLIASTAQLYLPIALFQVNFVFLLYLLHAHGMMSFLNLSYFVVGFYD